MGKLPEQYKDLYSRKQPRIIRDAMKEYGTWEYAGADNNPKILKWAEEVGGWVGDWYKKDSIPWCGLFMGVVAKRAKFPFNQKMLGAKNWLGWGVKVTTAMVGDVLVFSRSGGGHVGLYVGEDATHYHVLGGNQRDQVNIMRINKRRCIGIRRAKWRWFQPKAVKVVYRSSNNVNISTREA